jgi:hypothetical protein
MSNEIKSILEQAKSEVRREKWQAIIKNKNVRYSIFCVVAFILVFSIYSIIQQSRGEGFSEILHKSLLEQQSGDIETAKASLKKIHDSSLVPSGVYSLASLRYAAILSSEGEISKAIKIYQEINKCITCDDYISDLAGLLIVKLWLVDAEKISEKNLPAKIKKIESSASVLKFHIAEQRALLEMQRGNLEQSYKIFKMIAKKASESSPVKSRGEDGIQMLISKGFKTKIDK